MILMEERLNKKIEYLYSMADKYQELNQRTNNKYDWRLQGINLEIEALEKLKDNITNDWDEAYEEDLKESNIK